MDAEEVKEHCSGYWTLTRLSTSEEQMQVVLNQIKDEQPKIDKFTNEEVAAAICYFLARVNGVGGPSPSNRVSPKGLADSYNLELSRLLLCHSTLIPLFNRLASTPRILRVEDAL